MKSTLQALKQCGLKLDAGSNMDTSTCSKLAKESGNQIRLIMTLNLGYTLIFLWWTYTNCLITVNSLKMSNHDQNLSCHLTIANTK